MKKILLTVLMILCFTVPAMATDGWNVTMPFETGVTAFWFPTDNTIAGGLSETVLRIQYIDVNRPMLSKFSLDLDGTLAKEVNEAQDTLYGLGVKVNYHVVATSSSGITFEPSIGVTALRNLKGINDISDILKDYKIAIYGNVVLYKF